MALETLSENTRKIRRSLLAASLIGYSISKIDVRISKVTVFGTEFKIGDFQAIPFVLGLITFIFYALSEYAHFIRERYREELNRKRNSGDMDYQMGPSFFVNYLMIFRSFVELIVPIAIGIYACILVFFFTEFKVETTKAVKPAITIKTEKVIIQKQLINTEKKSTTDLD